jgi:hypothetical protein
VVGDFQAINNAIDNNIKQNIATILMNTPESRVDIIFWPICLLYFLVLFVENYGGAKLLNKNI